MKLFTLSTLRDIRFWIVLFFIVRLYGITLPPLEIGHNWRQTDGMMIARNFYERNSNIFYPTVDVGGEKTGIVGCEFPILNYSVFLVAKVFGFQHWYGRIIVLLFSCIGVYFFYRVIAKYFGENAAFNASIVLLASLWFSYSRKNIPDVFAASLGMISLFYATEYLERGRITFILIFFFTGLLACLSKILVAVLLTVLIFFIIDRKINLTRKVWFTLTSAVIFLAVCLWYFYWIPFLNETYGLGDHFFMGLPFSEGAVLILNNFNEVLKRFYDTPLKYTGSAALLISIIILIRNKNWKALACFFIPFLCFLILLVKTGASIVGDHYYVLTIIPAMAFVVGVGLDYITNKKIVAVLLLIIAVENIGNQVHDFQIREPLSSLTGLEAIMDGISNRDEMIAINADIDNPTAMYFAHRRGWVTSNEAIAQEEFQNEIRSKGCKYIVIARKLYGDPLLDLPVVYETDMFKVYQLGHER
jgi:4-amino-4-deoxy-L-arabinose transferase-like glycosyltransferase